ncbi:MAG: hypothetical protein MI806_31575 [Minwuiales bacterium]|nr:hypothetical protein [Minwuiales bacterium]MCG8695776.1 hypothetical protein [Minwuiales bacterium]
MTWLALNIADPTIPGLSGRDLAQRAARAARRISRGAFQRRHAKSPNDALTDLDVHQLRDIGIDRGAA